MSRQFLTFCRFLASVYALANLKPAPAPAG